jgi:glycosyltransferase involved in cell wall biosynthesis
MRHVVVMVTTSYPRFPGDGVGSFIEPIAKGVAARGHEVHIVAPWHPALTRQTVEDGVHFHFFRYAPVAPLNVFGYATGLRADTQLRLAAWMMAPLAMTSGAWKTLRVATKRRATVLHAHWVVPGGVIAALAARGLPLVISAHGSDVFVAERNDAARAAARRALRRAGWVTACSDDLRLRTINLGADPARTETVLYGVDASRFAPSGSVREEVRRELGIGDAPLVFSAGRLVRKKGFEHLIAAARLLGETFPDLRVVIAGEGDLRDELQALTQSAGGRVTLIGFRSQDDVGRLSAAADVVVVPSVRDEAGNVDGLPNFALEALSTATPVIATRIGGLPQAIEDGKTGRLVVERDPAALADAIRDLLWHPTRAHDLGVAARACVIRDFGWPRVAERFEAAYDRVRLEKPGRQEARKLGSVS